MAIRPIERWRRGQLQGLTPEQRAFIDSQPVARLATADARGEPHVVPICFSRDGDFIYTAVDRKPKRTTNLKRLRNIEETGRAAVLFDHYAEDWARLGWVQVRGEAEILLSGPEHENALSLLRARYPQYRSMDLTGAPVVRIVAHHVATWGNLN
ncbi:MAG: TIGR03668 family PPOX class F420-dependent oxidoreductase [Chloroflexi bacterium]|nr:TIGR03668 family PPOX class F420-dependent oxidoreductase [Chloroflexota bacterium]